MPEYQTYKQEVVDACHTLLGRGYLKATEGNISARVKDQKVFAITPSNYDYAKMQADDICILDYEAKLIEGAMKPSIESGMHAAVYQTRDEAGTETVVDIDDRHVRRARVEHSQKRGKPVKARAVTDGSRDGDDRNFNQPADDRRQRAFHPGDDNDDATTS